MATSSRTRGGSLAWPWSAGRVGAPPVRLRVDMLCTPWDLAPAVGAATPADADRRGPGLPRATLATQATGTPARVPRVDARQPTSAVHRTARHVQCGAPRRVRSVAWGARWSMRLARTAGRGPQGRSGLALRMCGPRGDAVEPEVVWSGRRRQGYIGQEQAGARARSWARQEGAVTARAGQPRRWLRRGEGRDAAPVSKKGASTPRAAVSATR